MSVRLSSQENVVCMFDSVTDTAFGPVFSGDDAETECDLFLDWYRSAFQNDIRSEWFSGNTQIVMERYARWHNAVHAMTGEFNVSVAESLVKRGAEV